MKGMNSILQKFTVELKEVAATIWQMHYYDVNIIEICLICNARLYVQSMPIGYDGFTDIYTC